MPGIGIGLGVSNSVSYSRKGIIDVWDPNVTASVTPTTGGLADGSLVLSVADQVGGITLNRFTTGYEPTYKTNILNGQACFRYSGTTQCLRSTSDVISISTWTTILVVQGNSSPSGRFLYTLFCNGSNFNGFLSTSNAPTARIVNAGGTSDKDTGAGAWVDNNPHTLFHINDGTHAGHTVYQDNVALSLSNGASTADPGTSTVSRQFFLGCNSGVGSPFTGDFFYAAIVDHALTAAERSQWQGFLKHRFPSLT